VAQIRGSRSEPVVVFIGLLAAAVVGSWLAGPDGNWDLRNYHAYNGIAAIRWSFTRDVAPAGIQSFLNPLFDIPYGIAMTVADGTVVLSAVLAFIQAWCWFAVARTARVLLDGDGLLDPRVITATLAAALGSAAISVSFTTFNDWIVAAFCCEAAASFVRLERGTSTRRSDLWGGAALGLALTVKLTSAPFAVALALAVLWIAPRTSVVRWLTGGAVVVTTCLVPWAAFLAARYGNPVFPLYGGLFDSPDGAASSFDDARFGARSVRDVLRLPWDLAKGTASYGEFPFRDWRPAAGLVFVILAMFLNRSGGRRFPGASVLAAVIIASTILWAVMFGIYRYWLAQEVLVSLLVAVAIIRFGHIAPQALAIITVAALAFQQAPDWGRNAQLHADIGPLGRRPVVLLAAGPPQGYLAASLPRDATLVSTQDFGAAFTTSGPLWRRVRAAMESGAARGQLYVVFDPQTGPAGMFPVPMRPSEDCASIETVRRLTLCTATLVEGTGAA
jgi:hypothetical protein